MRGAGSKRTPAMKAGTRNTFCVRILLSATCSSQGCFKTSKLDLPQRPWQKQLAVSWTSIWEKTGDFAFTLPVRPGSILTFINHRHLTPHHFNKELFLEFNLGPQVDWIGLNFCVLLIPMAYTLVTFVFSIVSRAWLMKLLTPWRQTLYTRGTIWESWWLEWTVLQILIMAQPFYPSENMKRSDQSCRTFSGAELRYHLCDLL